MLNNKNRLASLPDLAITDKKEGINFKMMSSDGVVDTSVSMKNFHLKSGASVSNFKDHDEHSITESSKNEILYQ